MSRTVFVNLPVADVAAAAAFYEAIGFTRDPVFSNPQGAAMIWSDAVRFMLLDRGFYATLTPKPIADSQTTSAALIALSFDTREEVDAISEAAIAAGGSEAHGPEDEGFMYSRGFYDLDGHGFGPFWMNPEAAAAAMENAHAAA